ncbi:MAG: response regulator, partial [Gammaproteobacteria bacterium]
GGAGKTVMMLSSANLGEDLKRAEQLRLGAYLVKPVKRNDLFRSINQVRNPQKISGTPKVSETARPGDGSTSATDKRILLVEDNPDNRMLIKAYLKKQPYQIDEAEHGQQAVEMFQATPYDLILMDVQMPILDGHAAARAIREIEASPEHNRDATPIIALTAHAIKEEQDKSLAAGCNAHLTKPIKKQTLIDALSEFVA